MSACKALPHRHLSIVLSCGAATKEQPCSRSFVWTHIWVANNGEEELSISIPLFFVFVEIISAPQFVVDTVFQPSEPSSQAKMTLKGPANLLPKLLGSFAVGVAAGRRCKM